MASSTRARVLSSTLAWPFDTRETVCDDTPARRATSAIDGRCAPARCPSVSAMAPHVFKSVLARHVSRELCSRKHPDVYANIPGLTRPSKPRDCTGKHDQSDARDLSEQDEDVSQLAKRGDTPDRPAPRPPAPARQA